jgi:5'-nucleotidase
MDSETTLRRRTFLGAAAATLTGAGTLAAVGTRAYASENAIEQAPPDLDATKYVDVQLLNITDLHGYLGPCDVDGYSLVTDQGVRKTVGGVAYMATHMRRLRAGRKNSIFFSAGDNFSGWPFQVDAHANEPTIEALNALGLQFSTVGNHELDQRFPDYLIDHIEKGIPYPVEGRDDSFLDSAGRPFAGANFSFYTANVVFTDSGATIVPAYNVVWVDAGEGRKIPIAFIHLTVSDAATGSTSYQPALKTLNQLEAVNRLAAELKAKGINAIIVNMHEGGSAGGNINGLTNPKGPAFDLARQASPDIAAVVTGHWHSAFNGMVADPNGVPRPVVEAGCHGQMINEITLKLDRQTGTVVRELTTSMNHANTHDVPPDPRLQKIANYWADQGVKRYAQPLAKQTADITRARNTLGESQMGNLAADFLYWDAHQHGDPVELSIFITGPRTGSVALSGDGLLYAKGPFSGDIDGQILFGEAWNAFGYGNPVLGVTVTGAQILTALQDQWRSGASGVVTFAPLAVSDNVRYAVDLHAPAGQRVTAETVLINGEPLDVNRDYRMAALAYTLINGDGTTAFLGFREPVRHDRDREGFTAYLRIRGTIDPPPLNRVRAVGAMVEEVLNG